MSLYSILLLFAASAGAVFSIAVFMLGKDRLTKNMLGLYNVSFSLWCFFQFMGENSSSSAEVLLWTRLNLAAASLIPFLFLCFVWAFLGAAAQKKHILVLLGTVSTLFILLLPTPFFVQGIASTSHFRYYPRGGPVYMVFALFFILQVFFGFSDLVRAFKISSGPKKNQIAYVLLASVLGFGGGILWFLPVFGLDIYPFGIFITPLYLLAGAYAVIRHRLLDIKLIIGGGIVYALIVTIFTGLYIAFTTVAVKVLDVGKGPAAAMPALLVLIIFSVMFNPLRSRFQRLVDRLMFGKVYDYKTTLKQLVFSVSSCMSMQELAFLATDRLREIIGLEGVAFYMSDEKNIRFRAVRRAGSMKRLPDAYAAEALPFGSRLAILLEEDVRDAATASFFRNTGASIFAPIVSGTSLRGFIFAGKKRAGQMWSGQDLDLIETFSANASVAVRNIFLSEKLMEGQFSLYQAEKSSAISALAGEMAHEIKNPLTAMKGMMQIFRENLSDGQFIKDFVSIMPRQIDRIGSVVNRLLKLESGPRTASREYLSVDDLVDDVLKLCVPKCDMSAIKVVRERSDRPLGIMADRECLEQVMFNLVLNAVQAMPGGGTLKVRTCGNILEIADTGDGIEKDMLARVFEPFYTTKEGGAGLGLFVTRKMLSDMGATIEVSSAPGRGTVFSVHFGCERGPSR